MREKNTTDQQYYQVVHPQTLVERVVVLARDRMYRDFLRLCRPKETDTILDVGVSDVVNDAANFIERLYPHQEYITAVGLGDGKSFHIAYPKATYAQITTGAKLPFQDKAFSISTANAVLEHVGSVEEQREFVQELLRVANTVFITVPNKYFPVEHHTALPLVHYWQKSFALACRISKKEEWVDEQNLILMSRRSLSRLVPEGVNARIGYTGFRLGPFSSNLYLLMNTSYKNS